MTTGEKIRYYRLKRGYTQEGLAKILNISKSYISKIENNYIKPDAELLSKIKSRLEIKDFAVSSEEVSAIRDRLYQWNKMMQNKKLNEAQETMPLLESIALSSMDQTTINLYHLFSLRLFLMLERIKDAQAQVNVLEEYYPVMESNEKYYFNYFTGIYYGMTKEYIKSVRNLMNAIEIDIEVKIYDCNLYYALANACSRMDYIPKSIVYSNIALEKAREQSNLVIVMYIEIILARSYVLICENKLALNLFEKCLKNAEISNNTEIIPIIYHNIARNYGKMGKHQEALDFFNKASQLYKTNSIIYLENKLHYIYALLNAGYESEAIDIAEEYSQAAQASGNEILYILFTSIKHLINLNNSEESRDYISSKAIPALLKNGMLIKAIEYCQALVDYYKRNNATKQALKYSELINTYYKDIFEGSGSI